MKKLFIISAVFLFIFLIFFGIYRLAFYRPQVSLPESITDIKNVEEPRVEDASDQKITTITTQKVIAPVLTPGELRIRYVSAETGNIEEIDLSGTNKQILFANTFSDIGHVAWSADREQALIQSASDKSYFIYDIASQTKTPFKDGVDTAVWTTTGNRILYKHFDQDTGKRTLNISDARGVNTKKLADIPWRLASFAQIPQSSLITLWRAPSAHEETVLQKVSAVGGGAPETIFTGHFGADYRFAPDGDTILLSATDRQSGTATTLALANEHGGEYRNLAILTLLSKTAWGHDSKTIYYAQPSGIPDGSVLPNDYDEKKFLTVDTFWKITLKSGKKERLIKLDEIGKEFDATSLFAPKGETMLFFINRADGLLYRLDL